MLGPILGGRLIKGNSKRTADARTLMIALSVGRDHDHWYKDVDGGAAMNLARLPVIIPKVVLLPLLTWELWPCIGEQDSTNNLSSLKQQSDGG